MTRKKYSCKLVLLGDTSVGKSSIVTRFAKKEFYEFQEPTIGAAFLTAKVKLEEGEITFELWDTAGQERYRTLAPMYYRGARAAIIAYDITQEDSFKGAQGWVNDVRHMRGDHCLLVLVGNKCDLQENRKVDKEDVDQFAEKNQLTHIETSAKTGKNVDHLFEMIAREAPRGEEERSRDTALDLQSRAQSPSSNSKGCC